VESVEEGGVPARTTPRDGVSTSPSTLRIIDRSTIKTPCRRSVAAHAKTPAIPNGVLTMRTSRDKAAPDHLRSDRSDLDCAERNSGDGHRLLISGGVPIDPDVGARLCGLCAGRVPCFDVGRHTESERGKSEDHDARTGVVAE